MKKYVALLLAVFVPTVFGAGTCQDTLIPTYFYPDWWNDGMSEVNSTTKLELDEFPDDPT